MKRLLTLLLIGAVLRFAGLDFGLPGKYRPDEEYVVGGALSFQQPGHTLNPGLFNYPSLYMYMNGALIGGARVAWRVFGLAPDGDYLRFDALRFQSASYVLARGLTAAFGVATLLLLYFVGRHLFSRNVALALVLLLAGNALHVRDSHFATTDVAVGFFALLIIWRCMVLLDRPTWKRYILVGALIGISAAIKYPAVVLAGTLVLVQLVRAVRSPLRLKRLSFYCQPLLAGVVSLAAFFICTPYVFLDYPAFRRDMQFVRSFAVHGLQGVAELHGPAWVWNFSQLSWGYGQILCAALGIAVLAVRVLKRDPQAWKPLLVLPFLASLIGIYLEAKWVPIRYFVPLLPCSMLLIGSALAAIEQRFSARRLLQPVLLAAVTLILAEPGYLRSIQIVQRLRRTDSRESARQWMAREMPKDAVIAIQDFPYGKPMLPEGLRYELLSGAAPIPSRFQYALTDEYPIFFFARGLTGEFGASIAARGTLLAEFSPFSGEGEPCERYDLSDAFFLPLDGFHRVERPGPVVRVYRLREAATQ